MPPIRSERPQDGPQIESLLDRAFGPDRHARPSYRLREGVDPVRDLCFVAEDEGRIVGTIRHWPVRIGAHGERACCWGRSRSTPCASGRGSADAWCGPVWIGPQRRDMRPSWLSAAPSFLVGAPAFLCRFGFSGADRFGITLPGLDDPRRLFALALAPGVFDRVHGAIQRVSESASLPPS